MADEEQRETEEAVAPDAEAVVVEDEPRADAEPDVVAAEPAEVEDTGGEDRTQEPEQQAAVLEDVPAETAAEPRPGATEADEAGGSPPEPTEAPQSEAVEAAVSGDEAQETVDELQPDTVVADESGNVPPEPESDRMPVEAADTQEVDVDHPSDGIEAEVVIPAATDEEPVAVEEMFEEQQQEAVDDILDEVLDGDGDYKDTVGSQPSDVDDAGMEIDELVKDLPQSTEQLVDLPSDVMPYPSADDIDVIEKDELAMFFPPDELSEVDRGDEPDPTRAGEKIGHVVECPDVPTALSLLLVGRDDIESPVEEESKVPSVLVCFLFCLYRHIGINCCESDAIVSITSNLVQSINTFVSFTHTFPSELSSKLSRAGSNNFFFIFPSDFTFCQ